MQVIKREMAKKRHGESTIAGDKDIDEWEDSVVVMKNKKIKCRYFDKGANTKVNADIFIQTKLWTVHKGR